jgi:hypothetical protein
MKNLQKTALMASLAGALLCGAASTVSAAEIERLYGPNAMSPIASAVSVPPGYTTFYVSRPRLTASPPISATSRSRPVRSWTT